MSVNTIYLSGRLGKDPEVRTTQSGSKVASFSLCTGGRYRTKDGREVDDTAWHSVIAWRSNAETVERFLHKGSQVLIVGHLTYREWTDQNGIKRIAAEIIADKVELAGPAPQQQRPATTPLPPAGDPQDDDMPF